MALFAPGVAQGALGAMDYQRQSDIDKQLAAQRKQAMEYQAYQMETSRAQEAARLRNAEQAGSLLRAPPPVEPQTPAPGQPSVPMQQPPAPPMFSQGQGMGQQPPPQMATQGMQQAMQPPPIPPYRSLAQGQGQGMPQPNPQARGDMAPPPVGATGMTPPSAPPQSPVGMLEQLIARMDKQGIPDADRVGVLAQLSPIIKESASEQLMQMREQGVQFSQQMKNLELMLKESNLQRLEKKDTTQAGQSQERIDVSKQRLQTAQRKAAAGAAPQATEMNDPEVARIFYDRWKLDNQSPPFAMGDKAGRNAWLKAVAKFAKEDRLTGGDIAAAQGAYKGDISTFRQLDQKLAAIEGQTGALSKVDADITPLFKKLNTSFGGQWGNQKINEFTSKFGDNADLQKLKVLASTYGREYQKAVTGAGSNAQMLATHKEDADALLNGNMPIGMVMGAIEGMKIDVKAMRDSLSDEKNITKSRMGGSDGAGAAAVAGPYSDADKEARYQAWKKQHASQ